MKLHNKKNLVLILLIIIIIVIVSIPRFIISAPEACITALDQTISYNKSVYGISKSDKNKILKFYEGISDLNLPKPKVEFGKLIKLSNLVHQEISILELPRKADGIYQFDFVFGFNKYSEDAYNNGEGYILKNSYNGVIYFAVEKLGFNNWKIREVRTNKISP